MDTIRVEGAVLEVLALGIAERERLGIWRPIHREQLTRHKRSLG
jgi:hypothetical protein